ncbi:unnamed protein product [Ceratitis capitata]|uniref:(Mediterranean fruit fly) hypothetical protein n=1 Tax=Ceratitis capitata TaxID=7213 RepID=A0A811VHB3_CERCA|nr:unnamed protein product [Ceratitis capitata]
MLTNILIELYYFCCFCCCYYWLYQTPCVGYVSNRCYSGAPSLTNESGVFTVSITHSKPQPHTRNPSNQSAPKAIYSDGSKSELSRVEPPPPKKSDRTLTASFSSKIDRQPSAPVVATKL